MTCSLSNLDSSYDSPASRSPPPKFDDSVDQQSGPLFYEGPSLPSGAPPERSSEFKGCLGEDPAVTTINCVEQSNSIASICTSSNPGSRPLRGILRNKRVVVIDDSANAERHMSGSDVVTPSSRPRKHPKTAREVGLYCFGYAVSSSWVVAYAARRGLPWPERPSGRQKALLELERLGSAQVYLVKNGDNYDFCFAIESNKTEKQIRHAYSSSRIQQLKKAMGIDGDPKWYKTVVS